MLLAYTNFNATAALATFVPSASGRGIFTQATGGDDLDSISGWDVSDVFVQVRAGGRRPSAARRPRATAGR